MLAAELYQQSSAMRSMTQLNKGRYPEHGKCVKVIIVLEQAR